MREGGREGNIYSNNLSLLQLPRAPCPLHSTQSMKALMVSLTSPSRQLMLQELAPPV